MATNSHPPLGDVSCRATGYSIQQLRRMGLPTAHLTQGLAYTLDDLQSHSASIPWDDYLVFLKNSHTDLPTDQLVELCTSYKRSLYLRPFLSAAGLWFHPARYFQWVAAPESGAIQQLFRCVRTRFTQVGERDVVVEEVIEPGFTLPPDIFWETQAIAFGALTTTFGLAPSIVTWEPIERGAAFRVHLPRRRPVRFVLSWLASWFRRDTAEDVRSALSFGHERSLRLQREIAERKQTQEALRESEERFRRIFDAVPGIVYQYYLDPDGRQGFVFVSGGATALSGYTPEELIARPELIWEGIDPDDVPGVQQAILESARNGTPWQHEFRFRTKAGDSRWIRGRSVPEPATATGRVKWNGILTDVTAERQADAELRARDALLQKLSEQVPGFIYQYQQWPDGRSSFPYASEGIRDIYEVTPEEVRVSAEAVFGRLHHDDLGAVVESIRRSLETLEPWLCEYRVRLPQRGVRWLDGHAIPERLPDGSTNWHGHIRDVTERKDAEEALRLKDTAIATAANAIAMTDADGRISYVNRAFFRMWGYDDPDEIIGRTPPELCHLPETAEAAIRALQATGSWIGELIGRRRDGTPFDTQVSANLIHDHSGRLTNMMASFVDVTERKRADEALRASEERWKFALEGAEAGVLDWDIASDRILFSDRWRDITGYRPGAIAETGDGLKGLVHPDDLPVAVRDLETTLAGSTTQHKVEHRLRCADGRWIWVESRSTVTSRGPDGAPLRMIGTHTDISERKRAEEALRESEARYRRAERGTNDGLWEWDIATGEDYFSPRWLEMLGYQPGELPHHVDTFAALMHPDDKPDVLAAVEWHFQRGDSYQVQMRLRCKTGEYLWVESRGLAERDIAGKPVRMTGSITDITDRRRTEEETRTARDRAERALADLRVAAARAEQFYRLCEVAGQGIGIARLDGTLTYMNPAFRRLLELPEGDDVTRRAFWELVPAESHQFLAETVLTQTRETGSWSGEFDLLTLSGKQVPIINTVVLLRDPDGTVVGYSNVATDITEQKRDEAALRESEERFRAYIDNAPTGLVVLDENGRYVDVNPASCRMSGYDREELLRMGVGDLTTPEAKSESRPTFDRIKQEGAVEVDWLLRRKSGELRQISIAAVRLSGNRFMGFITDITERKRAEQALRESESRYRTLIETSSDAIFLMDLTGRILSANPAAVRMHGYAMEELLAMRMQDLDLPDDAADLPDRMRRLQSGESLMFEVAHRRKDGTTFPLEVIASAVEIGGEWFVIGFNRDITDRKRGETELRESEERLRLALSAATAVAFVWDAATDSVVRYFSTEPALPANPSAPEPVAAVRARVHPDDRALFDAGVAACLANGSEYRNLYRAVRPDGTVRWLEEWGTLDRDWTGRPARLTGISIDVTERKETEAALRENAERLRIFVENAPAGVAMLDRDVRYISYSRRWLTDYGLGDQNLVGRSHYEVFPEVTERWKEIHRRCLTGVSERCEQDRFERADGTVEYLRWEIQPWTDATGAVGGLVFFTEMITDRVRAEDQVRASLREKEVMLKEIHHRVKNNLQVISSLLSLQAARVTHPAATDVLAESQNRVRAMALVHETLYRSEDLARVDLSRYLEELCGYLFRSYGVDSSRVRLELDVEPVTVSLDKTIPCGLVVNEVVSNSLKYAFPGKRSGCVTVRAHMRHDGHLTLTLADDGVGLPADFVLDRTSSLGLQLVTILTEQLGGQLTTDRSGGTRFDITFAP